MKVSEGAHDAPIPVSDEVCDGTKDDVSVGRDLVHGCRFVFGSNEKNLASTVNSLNELDVVYSRCVFQRM